MKIYIAGPMESVGGNWNFPLFDYVAKKLRATGCEVFSPADHIREQHGSLENVLKLDKVGARQARIRALLDEIKWVVLEADVIYMLPGWERSSGATAERAVALAVGVPVHLADPSISLMLDNVEIEIDVPEKTE